LDIGVPEGYEQDTIRCVRCGSILPIPAAVPATLEGAAPAAPPVIALPPLLYTRTGQGWESFRCECGRTIQISPAFAAPQIRCTGCGRTVEIR
jgi:ribosomal protein S27E